MKANRLVAIALLATCAAGCAARREAAPAPIAAPPPRPITVAPPAPPPSDWRDAPITAGAWSYASDTATTSAQFGSGETLLALRCDRATRAVTLSRAGAASAPLPMSVVTTTSTRPLTATPLAGAVPQLAVSLAASDPTLDEIAFSRGRFAVEVTGLPTLYLPAWPELGRVIEDCR